MKIQLLFAIIIAFQLLATSCDTEDSNFDNRLVGKWTILSISSGESNSKTNINPTYTLEFAKDSSYGITFDINPCGGNYSISSSNKINLALISCQKVCCDSDNANKVKELINSTKSYLLKSDTLSLNGSGTIILIRD